MKKWNERMLSINSTNTSGPRKSGIPAEVEIPAPVSTTIFLLSFSNLYNLLTFVAKDLADSRLSGNPQIPLLGYADNLLA